MEQETWGSLIYRNIGFFSVKEVPSVTERDELFSDNSSILYGYEDEDLDAGSPGLKGDGKDIVEHLEDHSAAILAPEDPFSLDTQEEEEEMMDKYEREAEESNSASPVLCFVVLLLAIVSGVLFASVLTLPFFVYAVSVMTLYAVGVSLPTLIKWTWPVLLVYSGAHALFLFVNQFNFDNDWIPEWVHGRMSYQDPWVSMSPSDLKTMWPIMAEFAVNLGLVLAVRVCRMFCSLADEVTSALGLLRVSLFCCLETSEGYPIGRAGTRASTAVANPRGCS